LGLEIAGGSKSADLFVVSRKGRHELVRSHLAPKDEEIVVKEGGGLEHHRLTDEEAAAPSLDDDQLATLASYAMTIEDHFRSPQDIEWALDDSGEIWILQSRPLALSEQSRFKSRGRVSAEPLVSGGVTIFPGRVSGPAFILDDLHLLSQTPKGSIVLAPRVTPEIVQIFPRISGLAAEWGNVAGHAAALLREFKVPSIFLMEGLFESIKNGDPISIDSAHRNVYPGTLWEGRDLETAEDDAERGAALDPISQNILQLNLTDPSAHSFRPSACKSTHDVLRYCHEKAVEVMFEANDYEMENAGQSTKEIKTKVPLNLYVLDLGGGIAMKDPARKQVEVEEIISAPFQSLWRGVSHPGVSWRRDLPASFSDLASVMASSMTPGSQTSRDLGMKSYVLVADEYLNLNSRLAYHFSLVDACLCDDPKRNHVSFRFAGGGATRYRRNLRACFLEACLEKYNFVVHRRGDLLNSWLRDLPYEDTDYALDILGRLIACTSQLDMYMSNRETMEWFVEQFLAGNYKFTTEDGEEKPPAG